MFRSDGGEELLALRRLERQHLEGGGGGEMEWLGAALEEAHERLQAFDAEGEEGVLRCVAALEPIVYRIDTQLRRHGLAEPR